MKRENSHAFSSRGAPSSLKASLLSNPSSKAPQMQNKRGTPNKIKVITAAKVKALASN